jgi:hypothetical protein
MLAGKTIGGKPIKDLHLQHIVVCAFNTGMRKGESLSLEWDRHIDLRHGFILLDKTKNGERGADTHFPHAPRNPLRDR